MSYKNLNLDRSRILELAANALPGATVEPLVQKGSAHECSILVDGKQSLLHFFFNNDGTTTILWKVGKHHDVSEIAAKHIAEYGVTNPQKSFSLALRGRAPHEVALLIEYLTNDIGATLIKQDDIDFPSHTAYRLQSKEGDAIIIKHYSNGTLQLQGKPLLLYRESVSFLSTWLSLEDVINSQTIAYNVKLDPAQVADELAAVLPTAHPFLDPVVIKMLSAAITLSKINVKMDDYSSFVFPALRGLEGYLKQLFASKGISLPKVNSFGGLFTKNATGSSFNLVPDERNRLNCGETCDAIQRCYSLFSKHRHGLFHVDEVVAATRIIQSRQEALDLVNVVLAEIENSYILIAQKRFGP